MLTGAQDMTLYSFDKDTAGSGRSARNSRCEAIWPALLNRRVLGGG
ncbi:MAG: hypothetical protein JSU71_02330 [Betaproteobacteria bacterium]|nr:MAG: hypothetical protein JSU71_02330 [Betaproteobacteria bacterium]